MRQLPSRCPEFVVGLLPGCCRPENGCGWTDQFIASIAGCLQQGILDVLDARGRICNQDTGRALLSTTRASLRNSSSARRRAAWFSASTMARSMALARRVRLSLRMKSVSSGFQQSNGHRLIDSARLTEDHSASSVAGLDQPECITKLQAGIL